ncbi:cobaltochelatase subunit CobN [Corynebacterium freneyi]|uniref:Cobaltochelatase CobN n=1 Tax=Corynebacterium freneyi TaxID=134034 RepID=A0ABS4U8B8_9CORY|nr:cobaltochelatase subunit CobN [Corynebacterium freneyi]MBP2332450.1 cobaltochelatase CobN [Corynebacterium freneyi]QXA53363.1 cobaltochelatase subunit CobN [Corynebacterium freneyi]WJZ05444.1 Aerobic cobaltochelatase subunit CobN [Corynebacterium freneyi]
MILLLSTSDTDLLSARAAAAKEADVEYRWANPARLLDDDLPGLLDGADIAVIRLLGGRRAWEEGIDAVIASGIPTVLVSGEQAPDAELTEYSTVPANVATTAHAYLAEGGPDNLAQLHNFLSDTLLFTGLGFAEPKRLPAWGHLERNWGSALDECNDDRTDEKAGGDIDAAASADVTGTAPVIGVIYYRAQHLAGNTAYVSALCSAIEKRGAVAKPIYAASLRTAGDDLIAELGTCDALITTVLAAGGNRPALAQAGGDDGTWDVAALAKLDMPIIQGLALTSPRQAWEDNDEGLTPLDVATQIAVPEFDGRLISVPFSFKEIDSDDLITYVPDFERCDRLAGIAVRHARLRHVDNADKKIAVMLSAYPTKHARIGNAVGLDTPASTLKVLHALDEAGYDLGDVTAIPGFTDYVAATAAGDAEARTAAADAFMHAIIDAGGQDPDWLTEEVMAANELRLPADTYLEHFETLPWQLRETMVDHWGEAPGSLYVHPKTRDIYIAGLRFGNVVVMVQPPRGFGDNPVGIYHDPDLPPTHHYLACYHWLARPADDGGFGADAVVHMGKHGNMEWLPGKTAGLSAECGPDQAIGELPLIYPFLVNDPGEGTQAKRRAHATLVDHMIPPMARAESYGDITRLEQLLDEHQNISAMDPAKLPAIRQEIWTLISAAQMDRDLGWEERPDEDVFDDMLMHVDGWLCEIKDAAIRGGLHILGDAPAGEDLSGTVATMLRARQLWGGEFTLPGLRESLGLSEDGSDDRVTVDRIDAIATTLVTALIDDPAVDLGSLADDVIGANGLDQSAAGTVVKLLEFTRDEILPRLAETSGEIPRILHALDGGFIPAGPSGSPLRGLVNVLPTGRNFYSVDPKAIPSRLAWETGVQLADGLIERFRADHDGEYPKSVGLSVWGTSAMRTSGDDIAEVLALLGVHPVWDEASRRITGLEVIPAEELGRPRIDVTVRISGFFRDAFPHVIDLLDDAVALVAGLDEPDDVNYVRAHAKADAATGEAQDGQPRPRRIFGSKPGTYGAGLLQLIDSGSWRDDEDLAAVYTTWGGYAYGRGVDGAPAADEMRTAYRRIQVAAKNADTREHDIADSDDYFQFHGGMVATVRALTGKDPEAYIGDSTRPDAVRTRTLHEETRRVFRARVVNPRWMSAMRAHGYKGAFEMAATVDYLFGYDATTGVMDDWMYETLTDEYVANPENREFFDKSNPWALHDISERLLEAADRKMWESPDEERLELLRRAFLETEGELEDR